MEKEEKDKRKEIKNDERGKMEKGRLREKIKRETTKI